MNFWHVFLGACALVLVLQIGAVIFGIAMGKAAAPKNEREQLIDDYQQMKALHYFDSPEGKLTGEILWEKMQNLTSGCPVENNK
jgi:hypothetical protein